MSGNVRGVIGLTALGVLMCCTASCAADKIGYIDLQKLVNASEMGKAAKAEIERMRAAKEAELKEKAGEIERLTQEVDSPENQADPILRRDRVEALQKAHKAYQRLTADAKEEIAREDKELVAVILQKADPILKQVAQRHKYTVILKDPNAIGYLDPKADITDLVLEALDKK